MAVPSGADGGWLARAVELGERGWGRVHPNPMVGCVLVRDGEVVGEGWHREFGGAHAEVEALREAGERSRGATAYVSLEPCTHEGKTPPCTGALLDAGVARVVYGAEDPGARSGGGGALLREAGVEVEGPLLDERAARRGNPVFFRSEERRPFVALKLTLSLDGRIARAPGTRTWISGPEGDAEVHRLRAGFDGILVGTRTVEVDNPLLTVRGELVPRVPPVRVLLDARGVVPPAARVFNEGGAPVWVLTGRQPEEGWAARIRDRGADIVSVPVGATGRIELDPALRALRERGLQSVLCEGGGVLGSALLVEGLVDRLILVLAPIFLGVSGVPVFPWIDSNAPPEGWGFLRRPRLVGRDLWCELDREG